MRRVGARSEGERGAATAACSIGKQGVECRKKLREEEGAETIRSRDSRAAPVKPRKFHPILVCTSRASSCGESVALPDVRW